MDIIYYIILIFSIIYAGIVTYVLRVSLKKISLYEQFIIDLRDRFEAAYNMIKESDIRGSFEADDEIGDVFTIIKQTVNDLNTRVQQ